MAEQADTQRPSVHNQEAVSAGVHFCKDPAGRHWRIRGFPMGELYVFQSLLEATILAQTGRDESIIWPLFLYHVMMHCDPVPWKVRLRRILGLRDFSLRYMKQNVEMKSAVYLRNEACIASLDQPFDVYVQRLIDEAAKKKAMMNQSGVK